MSGQGTRAAKTTFGIEGNYFLWSVVSRSFTLEMCFQRKEYCPLVNRWSQQERHLRGKFYSSLEFTTIILIDACVCVCVCARAHACGYMCPFACAYGFISLVCLTFSFSFRFSSSFSFSLLDWNDKITNVFFICYKMIKCGFNKKCFKILFIAL